MAINLSVNLNKVALLRSSRGGRNRKRKTATPASTESDAGVPMSEWIDELEE